MRGISLRCRDTGEHGTSARQHATSFGERALDRFVHYAAV